ncbi:UNVERIFIED_CONTAM: hypothetical protein Slati_0168400 [Sesamum latifolium]|uniref:Uncharacterized protein n=1 Tax=Sesamum latifolium TaxID=2727402 RepID=A0AAW2YAA9_9LAMI
MAPGMGNHDQEMEFARAEILRALTPLEVGSSSAPAPSAVATPTLANPNTMTDTRENGHRASKPL